MLTSAHTFIKCTLSSVFLMENKAINHSICSSSSKHEIECGVYITCEKDPLQVMGVLCLCGAAKGVCFSSFYAVKW